MLVLKQIHGIVWLAIVILLFQGCVLLPPDQNPSTAVILTPKIPAVGPAKELWEYAFLSALAYKDNCIERNPSNDNGFWKIMNKNGWHCWQDFPLDDPRKDDDLFDKLKKTHLGVQVWQKRTTDGDGSVRVVVAFRGTKSLNFKDWLSNLHWFRYVPFYEDAYSTLIVHFNREFVKEYKRHIVGACNEKVLKHMLYSTGHSLGAGLAQEFAYSLPIDCDVPRVTKVYAFDPSPVTGYFGVNSYIRDNNIKDMSIYRTYEYGEILEFLRVLPSWADFTQNVHFLQSIRFNLFSNWNPIHNHSIDQLACKLFDLVKPTTVKCVSCPET